MGVAKSKLFSFKKHKLCYSRANNDKKEQMKSQLIEGCYNADMDMIQKLLKRGVPVNFTSQNKYTCQYSFCPLHCVVSDLAPGQQASHHVNTTKLRSEILLLLFQYGADLNSCDSDGQTVVHIICKQHGTTSENLALLKILIQKGANLNMKDNFGNTPLHYCCMDTSNFDKKMYIKLILKDPEVDVNVQNNRGETPLHLSAHEGNAVTAKLLLNHKAQINVQDFHGKTPLHGTFTNNLYKFSGTYYRGTLTVTASQESVAKILLTMGADVNLQDNEGKSCFQLALDAKLEERNKELFSMYIAKGADLNTTDSAGDTLLHLCYNSVSSDLFNWLCGDLEGQKYINMGFSANRRNARGYIPLELCIEKLHLKSNRVEYLDNFAKILKRHIQAGADIRYMNEVSRTKLFHLLKETECAENPGYKDTIDMVKQCGFHYSSVDNSDSDTDLDSENYPCILPLQRLVANYIRLSLRPNAVVSINKLALPRRMKSYVMYD